MKTKNFLNTIQIIRTSPCHLISLTQTFTSLLNKAFEILTQNDCDVVVNQLFWIDCGRFSMFFLCLFILQLTNTDKNELFLFWFTHLWMTLIVQVDRYGSSFWIMTLFLSLLSSYSLCCLNKRNCLEIEIEAIEIEAGTNSEEILTEFVHLKWLD